MTEKQVVSISSSSKKCDERDSYVITVNRNNLQDTPAGKQDNICSGFNITSKRITNGK